MSQSIVKTFSIFGLEGHEITIEADANKALPTIDIIGLPDAAVKESKERLRATFRNLDIHLPPKKIVINLAPSDIKKSGTQFDLPMAVAVFLLLCGYIHHRELITEALFFGELGLDGSVRRVNGLLPAIMSAMKHGYKKFFVPADNVHELKYIQGITLYPLLSFREIVSAFMHGENIKTYNSSQSISYSSDHIHTSDFSAIKGHLIAKRALTIAAAGGHNVLMIGSPGSGKTLLANALSSIMPPLQFDEMLEVSQIYSLVGKLTKDNPIIRYRPFRPVHHTASKISIIGGGANLQPGEISLAHKGILFFDELAEFPREVLEVLRQPIEDKSITISRAAGSVSYPAHFMFVGAMNPCKCGYYKDREKSCTCSLAEIARYQAKISGPLLDRIDMALEIPRENIDALLERTNPVSSEELKNKVILAREIQQKRYAGTHIFSNSGIRAKEIQTYIVLDDRAESFLKQTANKLMLSGRIIHRMLKLARTIADIEGSESVLLEHLAEAMQYRNRTMFVERP